MASKITPEKAVSGLVYGFRCWLRPMTIKSCKTSLCRPDLCEDEAKSTNFSGDRIKSEPNTISSGG
ncbi:CLUMA_CG010799, isoform A [Clunio marinus]|uniref:CLUMA_CG010799, isoform A n=1 Tax=Clunio marinus TaxID=568069 RepID=A0A1J1ICD0_9DIPT|nr:CLUMA_CG010799, isoform A [Clunio marinus]